MPVKNDSARHSWDCRQHILQADIVFTVLIKGVPRDHEMEYASAWVQSANIQALEVSEAGTHVLECTVK